VITAEGEIIQDGQSVGVIDGPGQSVEVLSFATGYLMGMLAEAGQRVRPGQPVAWLRAVNGEPAPWR
jgi:hypothetical protein